MFIFALFLQPEAPATSSIQRVPRPEDEDDGDLNKALGVQRFQQILHPAAAVPDEQHHTYHEEDIEGKQKETPPLTYASWMQAHPCVMSADHRRSSRHIHRPLSKLPSEGRRKKSSKKRRKEKDHKSSLVPSSEPIEEGEDEDEEEDEGAEAPSAQSESDRSKDVEVSIRVHCWFVFENILFENCTTFVKERSPTVSEIIIEIRMRGN